jgi:hypothetical protein
MRMALTEHPGWCAMACNIKNAFNARNRNDILKILYRQKELAPLWRMAGWAYGTPTDLLIADKGKLVEILKSSQGVKQGDTLSSLLFALSMADLYSGTAEATGVKVVAVQDDVYFLGTKDQIMNAWKHFNAALKAGTGLEINKEKTGVLVPRGEEVKQLLAEGLKSSEASITALGTILTRDSNLLSSWLVNELNRKHQRLFRTITDRSMSTQVAFTLLRMSAVPLVQYWIRTTPPTASKRLAGDFDNLILRAASKILALPASLDTVARHQLNLPVKKGGFGLRSMKQLADAAWISATGQALQHCSQLVDWKGPTKMVTDPMERCLRRLNERMEQALLPQTAREFYDKYTKEPVVPGLQKEIMEIIEDKEHYKFLRGRVNKEVDSARWRCVAAEYAGLWLTTAPTHYMFRVADNHFRAASRILL